MTEATLRFGSTWPTDLNHAVVSPTRVLIGNTSDWGVCGTVKAVNFAINSVLHLTPHGYKDVATLPGAFPAPDFRSELRRGLSMDSKKAKAAVSKTDLASLMIAEALTDEGKAQLLALAVDLLGRFADLYKGLEGFIELYEPLLGILLHIRDQNRPGSLQTRLTSVTDTIRQYKQERKGTIRELRKDSRFLTGVEQKKQAEKDKMYNESLKKVYGSIQTERVEEKAMDREKSREKKRAGRK
ncbi:hypothetical protein DFH09DRAFT_1324470 [Mycena vulgaris]|nr:hypothetical protein DFH09DRAFT_1324470 [Mycena vulgaris]